MTEDLEIDALLNRAEVLHRRGKIADAESIYRRVLDHDPGNARAHHLLGLIALRTGSIDSALQLFRRSISLNPNQPAVHCDLGIALQRRGDLEGAIDAYKQSLKIDRSFELASLNLGAALTLSLRLEEAEDVLTQVIETNPRSAVGYNNLGNLHREKRELSDAVVAYKMAVEIEPGYAVAWSNAGVVLREQEEYDSATEYIKRALTLDNANPEFHKNLAHVLTETGQYKQAEAALKRTISVSPGDAQAHTNLANMLMLTGRWEEGWREYGWRIQNAGTNSSAERKPVWQGQSLSHETVRVVREQGVGDEILHAGLIPALQARGAEVVFECDPRLQVLLLSAAQPGIRFVTETSTEKADYYVPMAELVSHLGPDPRSVTFPKRYLSPDTARSDNCRALVAAAGSGMRIGISWRSAQRTEGGSKTVELRGWGPVFEAAPAVFVNLQYGETTEELADIQDSYGVSVLTDPSIDRYNDLAGLAAMIDTLDLVITTSNVTAHLAAALGKEVWLAVKRSPFWYWGGEGTSTPLYPTVRAYRQQSAGDWQPVIEAIASDLALRGDNK